MRQGRIGEREMHHQEGSRRGEQPGRGGLPTAGAGVLRWGRALGRRDPLQSLPAQPPSSSREFKPRIFPSGQHRSNRLPKASPERGAAERGHRNNCDNNVIKVASTQPSLGTGVRWQRGARRGVSPIPPAGRPHQTRIFRVSPLPICFGVRGVTPGRSKVVPRSPVSLPIGGTGTRHPRGSPDFGGYL